MNHKTTHIGSIICGVLLAVCWHAPALRADDAHTAEGTIVARSETTIDLLSDGQTKPVRYLLIPTAAHFDQKVLDFIKSLSVGMRVKLMWIPYRELKLANNVTVLSPPAGLEQQGTVTAVAVDNPKGMKYLEIKDDEGKTEQYSPMWRGSGFDQEMLAAFAKRHVGDRVAFTSHTDDHVRMLTLHVTGLAPATQPSADRGTVTGRITAKDKNSITLKPDSAGEVLHLLTQQIIGAKDAPDQAMVKAIGEAKVGDHVEVEWFRDGAARLVSLKPAGAPATVPAAGGH